MRSNPYLSRPAGSKEPFQFHFKRPTVVGKEVHLGSRPPSTHFAPAIGKYVPAEELYDNRPRKRQR
jgi:hypothetical protein